VFFCAEGRYRPLPASAETVGLYVAYLWLRGLVQPTSARTYPEIFLKRRLAAGFPNAGASDLVAEALSGNNNAWLYAHGSKPKRIALPAPVAWQLALLAVLTIDPVVRLRLKAVACHILMCRRANDVLILTAADLSFPAAGGVAFQIPRTNTDARRPGGERLAYVYPVSNFSSVAYLPVLLLRHSVDVHPSRFRPSRPLFRPGAFDPGGVLTAWLLAGLRMLDLAAPVGTVYVRHSNRGRGCTAMRKVGLGLDAIAQLAGMAIETLNHSYNDALAPVTAEAHFFFGRLLPRALSLPA